jgi:DNA-binding transcriptional regulator YiaG
MTPERLASIRRSFRLTQPQMAALLGVSGERTIRKWEIGERPIPATVDKLLSLLILSTHSTRQIMLRQARLDAGQSQWGAA